MKSKKILLSLVACLALSVFAIASVDPNGQTCTLDNSGKCHCVSLTDPDSGKNVGYRCDAGEGNGTAPCVCPGGATE